MRVMVALGKNKQKMQLFTDELHAGRIEDAPVQIKLCPLPNVHFTC